jgi:D-serine deaminase-like pyridoxal phosphate-dependent protein
VHVSEIPTPALLVDLAAFERNAATMADVGDVDLRHW